MRIFLVLIAAGLWMLAQAPKPAPPAAKPPAPLSDVVKLQVELEVRRAIMDGEVRTQQAIQQARMETRQEVEMLRREVQSLQQAVWSLQSRVRD